MWKLAAFGLDANNLGIPNGTTTISGGITGAIMLITQLVGMLAVVFLIYGGITFGISQGNPKQVQQAKDIIQYSVIGIIVASSGYAAVIVIATYIK